jgi:tmRNA-binding protein
MFGRVADGRRRVLIPVAMGRGKRLHHKRETEKSRLELQKVPAYAGKGVAWS